MSAADTWIRDTLGERAPTDEDLDGLLELIDRDIDESLCAPIGARGGGSARLRTQWLCGVRLELSERRAKGKARLEECSPS